MGDYLAGGKSAQYGCDEETQKNCCAACAALVAAPVAAPAASPAAAEDCKGDDAQWKHSQYSDTCADYQAGGKSAQYGCDDETQANCCTACNLLKLAAGGG